MTFVSTICALAREILYPLPAKKFRTWIACYWALFSSGEQISRSSMYCNIFPLGPRSRSRRSRLRACPNRWGLSLNPWSNTVHVICWCFSPGASHSKAKRYWDSLVSGMQKKNAPLKSKTVNHLALGGFLPRSHRDWVLWDGRWLQLHLWSQDLEPFARFRLFSFLRLGCYMANWWGPVAHKQGIYLLKAVVPLEPLFWEGIVSG